MNKNYTILTLSNGLRIACWQKPGCVSYIGMVVNAGSRDEDESHQGLAHFVEHTIFKGTENRNSWQISNRMEAVGGELNAYTSKEETMIYTNSPSGYEGRALDLLSDLIKRSKFPPGEIDMEREVVIEEIKSYLDSPSDSVFDEFEEKAYAYSGLSHNILGTPESVRKLKSEDCRKFIDTFYSPTNMVLYCCSNLSPAMVEKMAEKYFGDMPSKEVPSRRRMPPPMEIFNLTENRESHQANTIIGARTFGRHDERRFALFLLNNYLGGPSLNSRLNRELRDKRGYVYTVESNVSLLSDTGLFTVYFGSDPSTIKKCGKLINKEIDNILQGRLSETTIEKMKRQYCGQLTVSSDHIESRAMALGKSLLYFNELYDIHSTAERIKTVTKNELLEVAELLSPDKCSALSLL